ncbi:MAG: NADPH-dependent FMN reductase [Opitutales bacterium]
MALLVVSASLNSESYSRLLAREAERVLRADGHQPAFLDLRELPLPLCDGEKTYQDPNVLVARNLIAAADGIVLAAPIYNYDVNAALKNFVELTGKSWENKTVAFLCSAGGASSYMSIMALANSLMLDFRCVVVPRFVYATGDAFAGDRITDAQIAARVAACSRATQRLATAVKAGGPL